MLEVLVKLQVRSSVQVKVLVLAWRDTVIKQATPNDANYENLLFLEVLVHSKETPIL